MSVLYDGACPLCAREIAIYRRQKGADAIRWIDIRQHPESEIPLGLSRIEVLSRFHVIRSDGELAIGVAAFVELWKRLPAFQLLARLASLPPVFFIIEIGYTIFLRIRPLIHRIIFSRRIFSNE